jgi:hypothetical protein
MTQIIEHIFKLLTFNVYDDRHIDESSEEDEDGTQNKLHGDKTTFTIQMFGINEKGETASIMSNDFEPFFYLKVPNHWKKTHMEEFTNHLRGKLGRYYESSITYSNLIERKKLYDFDAGKKHRFIHIKFAENTCW